MTKTERELRRLLRAYPRAVLETDGRKGFVLRYGSRQKSLGSLSTGIDMKRIRNWLDG